MKNQDIRQMIQKYPIWAALGSVAVVGMFVFLLIMPAAKKQDAPSASMGSSGSKAAGISVGAMELQTYMKKIEKDYYNFEDRVRKMETQVADIHSVSDDIKKSQKNIDKTLNKLNKNLENKIEKKLGEFRSSMEEFNARSEAGLTEKKIELSVANLAVSDEQWAYLPLGSFCKGTLLTGVYAAADANNPLPVLISLDEAFYGPNQSRIPLKGTFVLGKAYGDLLSQRVFIQIAALSTVFPDGRTFEYEQNLGYVTDEAGELGVKGKVIYNTGRQLALSFMGGFVAGGAQALADSEVSTHRGILGDSSKEVTGDPAKHVIFSGLAQSSGKLSEYYEKQAESLVPAVHIGNGAKVFFIVQKGITIQGLPKDVTSRRSMD